MSWCWLLVCLWGCLQGGGVVHFVYVCLFFGVLVVFVWLSHGALCVPASSERIKDAGDEPENLEDAGGDTQGS